MKQKNSTTIISLIAVIVATIALFVAWQNRGSRIVGLPPSATEYVSVATTTQASFGEMKNMYNDAESNFSLKYPDEIGVARTQKSCYTDLYLMNEKGYPPFISLYNPACPSPFANLSAQSLEDYKKDYTRDDGVIISIVNTENISLPSVSQGIKQEYFIFSNAQEMENSDLSTRIPSVRYVFYNKEKGFYILQIMYLGGAQNSYRGLEEKIIATVKY